MEFVGMFIICSPTELKMPGYKGSILLPRKSDPKKKSYMRLIVVSKCSEAHCASEMHYHAECRILYKVQCSYLINRMKNKIKTQK